MTEIIEILVQNSPEVVEIAAMAKGDDGDQGIPGPQGNPGPQGAQGSQGPIGPQGPGGSLGHWGSFWSTVTQTAASANTAYAVSLNTTDSASSGVSFVSSSHILIANDGVYNFQFSLQLDRASGSGNDTVDVWLRKNGIDVADTDTKVIVSGGANAADTVASWNFLVAATAGDYFELMWCTTDVHIQLTAVAPQTGPTRPSIPSAIVTVQQVMNISTPDLAGYVPNNRTVNGKALSGNITLAASDVSAVPTSRTVNGHALTADVIVTANDVLPAQSGNAGKVLKTDGTNASWQAPAAGQILNVAMFSASDLNKTGSTSISSDAYTTMLSMSYTPVSASSYIIIELSVEYAIGGYGNDDFFSNIMVNGTMITHGHQSFTSNAGGGGGTRTGLLYPLVGRYTNSSTIAITIATAVRRGTADDGVTVYWNDATWLKITEIAR